MSNVLDGKYLYVITIENSPFVEELYAEWWRAFGDNCFTEASFLATEGSDRIDVLMAGNPGVVVETWL